MTGAATALATEAPQAPAAPSGGEAGSSTQPASGNAAGGVPDASEGTSAQPAGDGAGRQQAQGGEAPLPDEPEHHVPYKRFREVQTQLTRQRREYEGQRSKLEQQLQQFETEKAGLLEAKTNFEVLEKLLDANPDIADMLYERAGKGTGAEALAAGPTGLSPEMAALERKVDSVLGYIRGTQQTEAQRREQVEMRQTQEQLDGSIRGFLTERKLDEGWLEHAREFVLAKARQHPELDLDDVKYLLTEWYRPLRTTLTKQYETWRNGKELDRGLPPAVAGSPAVTTRPEAGANDQKTAAILAEQLKQRLGWGG